MKRRFTSALAIIFVATWACADVITVDKATGRIYSRTRRFLVPYEAADAGPSGIRLVRLYYTSETERDWVLFAEKTEPSGAFEFAAPGDGVYGFTVQAVDMAGHVEQKNGLELPSKPEVTVVVDTRPPQMTQVFPRQDMELAPGAHMRVRFRAHDPNLAPRTAEIHIRHAEEHDFTELESIDYSDGEFFATGPVLARGRYTVRLSVSDRAGNRATESFEFLCTRTPTAVREQPGPMGREWTLSIEAPPRAKSLAFDIDYVVEDIGGQPPAAVGLWYTTDEGATWQFYGLNPNIDPPFRFQAPAEGVYGFKLTATTRSGISEPPPTSGTKPDIITLVDVTYPTLMLDAPRGGESYPGGQVHYIRWTARDDNFGSLPISLYLSREGGPWELLAADLPNTGVYAWNVPLIDYAPYRLRIEAQDLVGNKTSVISDTFFIVSAPPETRIKSVIPSVAAVAISEAPSPPDATPPRPDPAPEPAEPAISPEEMSALISSATSMRLAGEYEDARAKLQEGLEKDPRAVKVRNELGALLTEMGRMDEAVEILQQARSLAPSDTDVLYNLGAALYLLGRYGESASAFETLSGMEPRSEAALWSLSKAYYQAQDIQGAREAWKRIVALEVPGSAYRQRAERALLSVGEPPGR